jgi:hypothetical protein
MKDTAKIVLAKAGPFLGSVVVVGRKKAQEAQAQK